MFEEEVKEHAAAMHWIHSSRNYSFGILSGDFVKK
jgi:hypothetical protein